jgi:3-oxoacyl-[acyl-carrier-protein] synthase II
MEMAIADAGMKPEDVDYINAHGTATHHNDLFETKAIKLALGDHAKKVKINSTKSMIGHLLGAAGGVEFITCVKSIQEGYVHATAGLEVDDPECDLDYTKGEGVSMEVNCAISNSLGFGGHNATLLVKKYEA